MIISLLCSEVVLFLGIGASCFDGHKKSLDYHLSSTGSAIVLSISLSCTLLVVRYGSSDVVCEK